MGALTETEIFDFMHENFRRAAESCGSLAVLEGGFIELRKQLQYLDGCCRQAAVWRGDARWLAVAAIVGQAGQEIGDWVRTRQYRKFVTLRAILENGAKAAEQLRTQKTGRAGDILPLIQAPPHRQNRPVTVILPEGYEPAPPAPTVH